MNLHSTSIAVVGVTAELLGALDGRQRGIYVSHLVETRPAPEVDRTPRADVTHVHLRLSDIARAKLATVPNASRFVDALVRAAWTETVEAVKILREQGMGPSQILATWELAHAVKPISHSHLFMAVDFASLDRKRWRISRDTAALLGTSNLGQQILDLARLVPLECENVIGAAALAEVERMRRAAKKEATAP